jgi:hypothetical protein
MAVSVASNCASVMQSRQQHAGFEVRAEVGLRGSRAQVGEGLERAGLGVLGVRMAGLGERPDGIAGLRHDADGIRAAVAEQREAMHVAGSFTP